MSRRTNPPFPTTPFGLLLVEGGDERGLCEAVAGPAVWQGLVCWYGSGGTDLPFLAALAARDPSIAYARSVGVVLDMEDDPKEAYRIAQETLAAFGATTPPVHGVLAGQPRALGAFLAPDGKSPGSIEHLCRMAVRDPKLSACVDALVGCAQPLHSTAALGAKGWLNAYLAMSPDPRLRFHQAFTAGAGGIDPAHPAFDPLRNFLQRL
ncbi:DUF3226 domain-containing protein [Archangium sp.]|uniref:DUF3226 domain-containing protein n=1 Tax=Archangium sp. TaxID=1872627 RepID=UPI00286C4C41|nr:DUF3226 domain-containing protein [Archangium sp.]